MKFHPTALQGEHGDEKLRAVMESYFRGGGMELQLNIVSADTLRDAQKHPEKYTGLQVRVCGWNVRFNDLAEKEQNAYIERARRIAE